MGINSKNIYPRVMVLALCISSNVVNSSVKFPEDILYGFQVTERARFLTDRQTDGQTTMAKTICLPTLKWGDIKLSKKISNDQELINQIPYTALKTKREITKYIHKMTAVYERQAR